MASHRQGTGSARVSPERHSKLRHLQLLDGDDKSHGQIALPRLSLRQLHYSEHHQLCRELEMANLIWRDRNGDYCRQRCFLGI